MPGLLQCGRHTCVCWPNTQWSLAARLENATIAKQSVGKVGRTSRVHQHCLRSGKGPMTDSQHPTHPALLHAVFLNF